MVFFTIIHVVLMCLVNSLLPVGVFLVCVRCCISGIQGVVDVIAAVTTYPGRLLKYILSL